MDFKYKKEVVRGAQEYFINKLKLTVDRQVIGNIAQLARIPNTFHIKANKFCIPLTKEQFEKGNEYIKILSTKQNFVNSIYMGRKLLDISEWDIAPTNEFNLNLPKIPIENLESLRETKDFPPCLAILLGNKNMKWKERYLLIIYLKEKGFSQKEIFQILKKHLSEKKLKHCIKEEKQLQYLFKRDDLMFPSCESIMKDGFCNSKCKFFNNVVYK